MDQVKIGAFIAALRREKDWTQEELGERVGVTNKTVSRWENGNYMPSIEVLSLLSGEFSVSLTELVQGQRLEDGDFRAAADENLASAMERPFDRFRRWLARNGMALVMVLVLCVVLGVSWTGYFQYRKENPRDVGAVGTWCTNPGPPGNGEYIVLQRDYWPQYEQGLFFRYRQFEPLEQGSWQADGPLVTVTVEGRSFQALIKGSVLYVPDEEGRLIGYQKISDVAMFINAHFEE